MFTKNKAIITCLIFGFGILPSYAKIDGGISKTNFFDTSKTIMEEIEPNYTLTTGKYWDSNPLRVNKYRPLFMLSNKELFSLMPRDEVGVVQRISAPTVYNISLKSSSITKVSLNPSPAKALNLPPKAVVKPVLKQEFNSEYNSIYEQAKNPNVEPEAKVDAAILLKNSKITSNYIRAIDLLNDVTRKEPYNAYAFYLKGEVYGAQKDSQNAMKNYIQAIKINPTSKQCYFGIAKILESSNKELAQKYYALAK